MSGRGREEAGQGRGARRPGFRKSLQGWIEQGGSYTPSNRRGGRWCAAWRYQQMAQDSATNRASQFPSGSLPMGGSGARDVAAGQHLPLVVKK